MDALQKRTYLVYSRGLLPEDLSLGSLYLDPANPLDGERKRFSCPLKHPDLDNWIGRPERDEPCVLNFTASRQWLINSGLFSLMKGQVSNGGSENVNVTGKAGRRLRIKEPERFLNDVILASPTAREWLAHKLSISRLMHILSHLGWAKLPKIWMVTGIQCIEGAKVDSTLTQNQKSSASASAPMPEIVSAATAVLGGQGGVSGSFEADSKSSAGISYGHEDERIWAAQFTQLAVTFNSSKRTADDLPSRIPLRDLVDIQSGAIRAGLDPSQLKLDEQSADIHVSVEDDNEEIDGEELLKKMNDVDWGMLNKYLE